MSALLNEISYYAKCQLKKGSSVLLIGNKCDILQKYLTDFKVTLCGEKDLHQEKENFFDAAIVSFKFHEFQEYKDAENLLSSLISLIKAQGHILICERTGDSSLNLSQYTNRFESHRNKGSKSSCGLELLWEQCLSDSIYRKNDWNMHCWMLKKSEYAPSGQKNDGQTVRAFLDKNQYTEFGIRSYEWIFGAGFISPGGAKQNSRFLQLLDLKPEETVLDIGCGIGGNAFQIAKDYGAHVVGVDLSSNMITVACDRACLRRDTRVKFMIADITKYEFPANTFDVIYSRDAIIHIPDKTHLFTKCYKWLKPGGRMLITDYVTGETKLSQDFVDYVKDRHYTLLPLKAYEEAAERAGFEKTQTEDLTQEFKQTLLDEMQRAEENKMEFLQMFSAEKFDYLLSGWKKKIVFIDKGDHKWGMLRAFKH